MPMSYSTVMVHIDAEGSSSGRIEIASDLAGRFQATLIGIGGWSPGMGFATDVAVIDTEPVQRQQEELVALMVAAEQQFRGVASAFKAIKHVEWRGALCLPFEHLIRESRAADLVVIGRDVLLGQHCVAIDPSAASLRMGRPVLVVPPGVDGLSARRIVVAWKDCREARRAVRDALPMLRNAEEVLLAQVSETAIQDVAVKTLDDVADYLKRHRVSVAAKVYLRREDTIASDLLVYSQTEGADLLVAGAYGHSRLGEWMFGGVTRDLFAMSPICCLLAH
jgi:nucleotide-binding universal stress UspA family protein